MMTMKYDITSLNYNCDKVDIIWKQGREEGGGGKSLRSRRLSTIECDNRDLIQNVSVTLSVIVITTESRDPHSLFRPREAVQTQQPGPSSLTLSRLMVPVIILTILLLLSLVITAGVCGYIRWETFLISSFLKWMQFIYLAISGSQCSRALHPTNPKVLAL